MSAYGLVAAFDSKEEVVRAAKAAYGAGYRKMDAYTPVPVDGLAEALGHEGTWMPLLVLSGGIVGGVGGYFMQWYAMAYFYPLNIGGRPLNSWPMFIPITFELTVLTAALCGVFGMLLLNGLPRYHHPIFGTPGIERATVDRYFLCLESADARWDEAGTRRFLEELHPAEIMETPR